MDNFLRSHQEFRWVEEEITLVSKSMACVHLVLLQLLLCAFSFATAPLVAHTSFSQRKSSSVAWTTEM